MKIKVNKIHEVEVFTQRPNNVIELESNKNKDKISTIPQEECITINPSDEDNFEFTQDRDDLKNIWRTQMNYFNAVLSDLYEKEEYRDKFVALSDYEIIGIGENKFDLYRRIKNEYPERIIFILKVEEELQKYNIDTPKVNW